MNPLPTRSQPATPTPSLAEEPHGYSDARVLHWFASARRLSGFATRQRQDEWMDQPDLDAGLHVNALAGLSRLNRLSGAARILATPMWQLARQRELRSPKILDLACGGGDLAIRLWRSGRQQGFEPRIVGWDKSPLAVEHARRAAAECRAGVTFECVDLFSEQSLPGEPFDIALCSLFLHHLEEPQAVELLALMARLSRHLVLVNDLHRGRVNTLLVGLASRLVTRSPVVHVDALRSMRAAFTPAEVAQLAERAGLADAVVQTRWPCRLLLTWRKAP